MHWAKLLGFSVAAIFSSCCSPRGVYCADWDSGLDSGGTSREQPPSTTTSFLRYPMSYTVQQQQQTATQVADDIYNSAASGSQQPAQQFAQQTHRPWSEPILGAQQSQDDPWAAAAAVLKLQGLKPPPPGFETHVPGSPHPAWGRWSQHYPGAGPALPGNMPLDTRGHPNWNMYQPQDDQRHVPEILQTPDQDFTAAQLETQFRNYQQHYAVEDFNIATPVPAATQFLGPVPATQFLGPGSGPFIYSPNFSIPEHQVPLQQPISNVFPGGGLSKCRRLLLTLDPV
jgi:hypothetical protein